MKRGYFMLGVLALLALAVSCNAGNKPAKENHLRFAVWDRSMANYWDITANGFMETHPGVTVELVDIPSADYETKMGIMLASGDDVDVITMKTLAQITNAIAKEQIIPLEPYIEKDQLNLAPYGSAIENNKINGTIYTLPIRSDTTLIYYNKDLLDAAGLAYPTVDTTWEEYRDMAKKLTKGEGANKVWGTYFHTWDSIGQLPGRASGVGTMDSGNYEFLRPSYELLLAMQNEDKSMMDFGSMKAGNIHYSAPFYKGQVAMLPMGSHFVEMIANAKARGETDINWGIAALPHFKNLPAGLTSGAATGIGINAKSPNKDLAWEFLKYASSKENAIALAKAATRPGYVDEEVSAILVEGAGLDASNANAYNSALFLEFKPTPKGGMIERISIEEHDLIMLGAKTIDQGLKEMTDRVAKL